MKAFKKLAGLILAVCLAVPMIGTVAFAADGVLMYSDPSTKVGDNVSIDLVVKSNSGETVGNVQVSMTYDPSALEFVSGTGFTADGSGTLTYSGKGSGAELRAPVTFRALKTGEAKLNVDSTTATMADGETLELKEGSSTVTIAAADDGTTQVEPTGSSASSSSAAGETTDITVTVSGKDYKFSEAFTGTDIPDGFSETTVNFNGEDRKFVANDAGVTLGYLVDDSGDGSFFLFNQDDSTFAPFIQLIVSDTTNIVPLDQADSVNLPDSYQKVELTVQEQKYPAWSDPSIPRYYLIYALNTRTGESHLYQYDTEDGTYQYYAQSDDKEGASDVTGLPIPGKIGDMINSHLTLVFILAALIGLVILILMIIFAVKLLHRNQELDDLYAEYDIPYEEEEEEEKVRDKKSKKKLFGKSEPKEEKEDANASDDYEEYDDDDESEDDYDDYGDDDYDDEDDYDDYDDDDYDDDDYDDYEDDSADTKVKKKNSKKNQDSDEDFNINFIDV